MSLNTTVNQIRPTGFELNPAQVAPLNPISNNPLKKPTISFSPSLPFPYTCAHPLPPSQSCASLIPRLVLPLTSRLLSSAVRCFPPPSLRPLAAPARRRLSPPTSLHSPLLPSSIAARSLPLPTSLHSPLLPSSAAARSLPSPASLPSSLLPPFSHRRLPPPTSRPHRYLPTFIVGHSLPCPSAAFRIDPSHAVVSSTSYLCLPPSCRRFGSSVAGPGLPLAGSEPLATEHALLVASSFPMKGGSRRGSAS